METEVTLKMRAFVVAVLVCLTVSFSANETLASGELAPGAPLPNSEARQSLAKKWAAEFVALDQQIPSLSPSQQEWLNREYYQELASVENRHTARSVAATNSIEYQIHIAKPITEELVKIFSRIASGNLSDRKYEMTLWTTVMDRFIDVDYWQAVTNLVSRGVIQKTVGHVDSLYSENFSLQAQEILSKILIPYLQDQLP
ncbi:MAG: hypothetical protein O7B98_18030 [Alphaproteobacteria bacterium]|nr:hypothetical protein [Alphaproteobacteria bacterium]